MVAKWCKAEVDKLDLARLANFSTSLNNLKTKLDDLDAGKLKTVPVDLENASDVVDNEAVKSTKFNRINPKVNI